MDWITGLPVSHGYDAILVCVDKFTKRPKYIATSVTSTAQQAAEEFFEHVVRHHGVPKTIVSDRDPRFTGAFWTSLMAYMGINHSKSSAGRAQTDGQTERQNRTLEDSLRCMISYIGDDRAAHLGTVEFAHMSLVQSSTQRTPFELDTGRLPRRPHMDGNPDLDSLARNFGDHRLALIAEATEQLQRAQARQKKAYDRHRLAVSFTVGDAVYVATKHIPEHHVQAVGLDGAVTRPKLTPRFAGPFRVVRVNNPNVMELDLPRSMHRMHPVFNLDQLKLAIDCPARFLTRPLPKACLYLVDDNGERVYLVHAILDENVRADGSRFIKVHWHGEAESQATWEPAANIENMPHYTRLMREFDNR